VQAGLLPLGVPQAVIENVKKLIMRAIEGYRNDRDPPRHTNNNDHLK
jgi:hypothetical protein